MKTEPGSWGTSPGLSSWPLLKITHRIYNFQDNFGSGFGMPRIWTMPPTPDAVGSATSGHISSQSGPSERTVSYFGSGAMCGGKKSEGKYFEEFQHIGDLTHFI